MNLLCIFLIEATFAITSVVLSGPHGTMVSIPAGQFERADGKTVYIAAYSLGATEITWSQFKNVRDWGLRNGYTFEEGIGEANLPAQNITWFDAVKWCNALSEVSGKTPAYYSDNAHTIVCRQGRPDLVNALVKWDADGFRLPTEGEWEYAYRGGTTSCFYWGNFPREEPINHEYAAFHVWGSDEIDGGPISVASKRPNPFGLYDMAGNVEEWVWDRYGIEYEGFGTKNPRGPDVGSLRVLRGGGIVIDRLFSADVRHPTYPTHVNCDIGFRVASSNPAADGKVLADVDIPRPSRTESTPFVEPHKLLDVRADTDEAACLRVVPFLDLNHSEMQRVREACETKDYTGALIALRNLYAGRLRASHLEPWFSGSVDRQQADRWLAIYHQKRPICWAGPDADIESPWGFVPDDNLAKAYAQTKKREYADAYFWMVNEAALRAKPTWNRLTKAEKGSGGKPRDSFYGFIGFDAGDVLKPFSNIAWMLKHGLPEEAIPPRVFANALYSAMVDRLASGLQDDRGAVPNQAWSNAVAILEFSTLFSELKDSQLLRSEAIARIRNAMGTVMPDGTDLEASLNYNKMLLDHREKVNRLFPDRAAWPNWLIELNERTNYRNYMYAALATPFGTFPGVGNQQATNLLARDMLLQWRAEHRLTGLESVLAPLLMDAPTESLRPTFTSVGLPYGGYYAQRSGWSKDDLYLFLRSSRDGVGHNHRDNNSIQVAAHGAWLLVDSGSPAYGPSFLPEHQKKYSHYFGEQSLGSVFAANGLAVNGMAQGGTYEKLAGPTSGWRVPRQNILHHSETFDVVEGTFDGWYESEQPLSDTALRDLVTDYGVVETAEIVAYNTRLKEGDDQKLHALHRRQATFLKPEQFWVLVDEINGGREYTQTWNFPPPSPRPDSAAIAPPSSDAVSDQNSRHAFGFDQDDVKCDEASKRILTLSRNRPNIGILNFHGSPLRYSRHFGQMFPMRGWHSHDIGGEKVPSVQVEGTWQGEAPMITVLYPMKANPSPDATADVLVERFEDRSELGISGFAYTDKGVTVTCLASAKPVVLRVGRVEATARLLLVREEDHQQLSGLVLNCDDISVSGAKQQDALPPSFEFSCSDGSWHTTAIRAPSAFRWIDAEGGQLMPAYE